MGLVGDKILYIGTSTASITDRSDARAWSGYICSADLHM